MSEDNPYAPPKIDLTGIDDVLPDAGLADRGTRFVAAFVDGIIGICYGLPAPLPAGALDGYIAAGQEPPFPLTITIAGKPRSSFAWLPRDPWLSSHVEGPDCRKDAHGHSDCRLARKCS